MSSLRWMTYCGLKEELDDARAELLAAQTSENLDAAIRAELTLNEFVQTCIEDSERLDLLDEFGNGDPWIVRDSETGRGLRLHNTDRRFGSRKTVREAIDDYRDYRIREAAR